MVWLTKARYKSALVSKHGVTDNLSTLLNNEPNPCHIGRNTAQLSVERQSHLALLFHVEPSYCTFMYTSSFCFRVNTIGQYFKISLYVFIPQVVLPYGWWHVPEHSGPADTGAEVQPHSGLVPGQAQSEPPAGGERHWEQGGMYTHIDTINIIPFYSSVFSLLNQ